MAGAQWKDGKFKGAGESKSQFLHDCKDSRMTHKHTNKDIDLTRTKLNFAYKGLSYKEMCEAYDKRISEIEIGRESSGKNARVTLQKIVIYAPPWIDENDMDKIHDFFKNVGDILADEYGNNFLDMPVHGDEIHDYIDPDTKQLTRSRWHGQVSVIPEVDGKLNGKKFSSRANITKLNNLIEEMCLREYGQHYMDGTGKKGQKTVERAKNASAKAVADMAKENAKKSEELDIREQNIDAEVADQRKLMFSKTKKAEFERTKARQQQELLDAQQKLIEEQREHDDILLSIEYAQMQYTLDSVALVMEDEMIKKQEKMQADFQVKEDALEAQKAIATKEIELARDMKSEAFKAKLQYERLFDDASISVSQARTIRQQYQERERSAWAHFQSIADKEFEDKDEQYSL